MECLLHDAGELGIVELVLPAREPAQAQQRYAQRADRVPDTQEGDLRRRPGVALAKRSRGGSVDMVVAPAIELIGLFDPVGVFAPQNSALADQAHGTPCRIRATAEAEQVEAVSLLVVVDEEPVGVENVVVKALAEGSPADPVHEA